jgi:hypothetical protein
MSVLAGCAGQALPGGTDPAPAQLSQGPQNCRDFTMPVTIGGQQQQAVGRACPQPDGSWRVTQNTPGLPEQVYTVPPQAMNIYPYPDPYPYYWGDPWFYGPGLYGPSFFAGGPVFLAQHFHRFHHNGGFHHGGFHHGGGHGGGHGGHR